MILVFIGVVAAVAIMLSWGADIDAQATARLDAVRAARPTRPTRRAS